MRITLAIHSLSHGGAERVASVLANGFAEAGDEVMILTTRPPATDFYPLSAGIEREWIGSLQDGGFLQLSWNNLLRLQRIRNLVTAWKPAAVISFMGTMNVRTLLALRGAGIPVVVSEHTDPRHERLPGAFGIGRRLTYPLCTALVSVSQGVDSCFQWLAPRKRFVIHNPLPLHLDELRNELPTWTPGTGRRTLVSLGRLLPVKGIDLLIRSFGRISAEYPEWDLLIIGDGPDRSRLEDLVTHLQIGHCTRFLGTLDNPFAVLSVCDLFVLPSRWEGFGNALVEAMACGLPVIATDCRSGPGEIINHGETGMLVPVEDVDALAEALRQAMGDDDLRRSLGTGGQEASARFQPERILRQWRGLLESLA